MSVITKDLGAATAYGYAVEKGYTGTEEEFAELMASYATVGQTAVDAKDAAVAAKTAAQTAATTATNKASEATTAAQTATTKAGEASTSASTATSAKDTAVSASQTATSKATEATTAAATATSAASTATTAKDDAVSAKTAAQTAQTGAETARDAVQSSAAQIAANASDITALKEDLTAINCIVAKPNISYGAYTISSDGKDFYEVDNTVRAKTDICYTNKCGFKLLVELPSTLRIQAAQKCVDGIWTALGFPDPYGGIITIDTLASAIRMTFRNKDNSSAEITTNELKSISVTFLHDDYFEKVIPDSPTWYYGKKYAALGDSITYGYIPRNYEGYPGQLDSYAKLTAQALGMTFVNYGYSGDTIAAVGDITNPMSVRYTQLPDDADLITVMGGTNDIRLGVPTGQMSDRTNTTFYGALHVLLSGLYKKYYIDQGVTVGKAKKIVVCTPIKLLLSSASAQGGTGTLRDMTAYCNAIKEVAAYYSFPVIDLYNLSGINPHLDETLQGTETGYTGFYNPYITDGTHPTQEGQQMIANVLCGFLKTLI